MPLVTVVTPCYNGAKFLAETIESVIAQTFTDWEMIVVDDCSSDNSIEIVKGYSQKDSRIRSLCTEHNTGSPAIPRNLGLETAQGKYIALLDADDIWYPTKLQKQVEMLEANNYQIMYSNGDMMDEKGEHLRKINKAAKSDYWGTLMQNELSCSATIFRRDMVGDIRFKNMVKEDFVFWLELMRTSKAIAYNTGTREYSYRIITGSRSRNKQNIIRQQWSVLRNIEKLNFFVAAYCFCRWALRNVKKYYM